MKVRTNQSILWVGLVATWAVVVLLMGLTAIPDPAKGMVIEYIVTVASIVFAILAARQQAWGLMVAAILTTQITVVVWVIVVVLALI